VSVLFWASAAVARVGLLRGRIVGAIYGGMGTRGTGSAIEVVLEAPGSAVITGITDAGLTLSCTRDPEDESFISTVTGLRRNTNPLYP